MLVSFSSMNLPQDFMFQLLGRNIANDINGTWGFNAIEKIILIHFCFSFNFKLGYFIKNQNYYVQQNIDDIQHKMSLNILKVSYNMWYYLLTLIKVKITHHGLPKNHFLVEYRILWKFNSSVIIWTKHFRKL